MIFEVERQLIERYNVPSNSDLNRHIKNINLEKLFKFESGIVPELGEILVYKNEIYEIVQKIRVLPEDIETERMILRVKNYSESKYFSSGSNAWCEHIPLID